ncbi:MAG: hypothetical protein DRP87_19645 [Spirochaetes bacterium]|nr:MAG: hypothetical protein DRP87_19645 [Spirochaetota bacterium]
MKTILIRDIDPQIYSALKRLASLHHRSLQGELHAIIEQAVKKAPLRSETEELQLITVNTGGKSTWRREEIYGDKGR